MTDRFRLALVLAILCASARAATVAPAPAATAPAARPWSLRVRGALASYCAGDYAAAQERCEQILTQSPDPLTRRDAAVVQTLCLLRMPARSDRMEGRARLAQLSREDPTLDSEPECNLAFGIAQTALSETASALDALQRAMDGFAAGALPDREAAALVALAEAWACHSEWELTPPRFEVRRPAGAAEADALRRAHIAAVRERLAALPGHEDALAAVDLALARCGMRSNPPDEQAVAILQRLAARPTPSPTTLEAASLLAGCFEQQGRVADAQALYERIRTQGPLELSRTAADRLAALAKPAIEIEAPASAPTGSPIALRVRTRGLQAVRIEVRALNIDSWLSDPQGRGNDARLPESGSLQAAWSPQLPAADSSAVWDSAALSEPPEFSAPPGAYVVIVRGVGSDARELRSKRVLIVSDLVATCFLGSRTATVWATARPGAATPPDVSGRFWMQRSFAPVELRFEAGVARFPLPAESRVMLARGWLCLVRAGPHLALCRGQLAAATGADEAAVLLVGGPPTSAVGETLHVAGWLEPGLAAPAADAPPEIELQVVDLADRRMATKTVWPEASGAFATRFPIAPDFAGRHLRVIARQGGRVLENLAGRLAVHVPADDAGQVRVRCVAPAWIDPRLGVLMATVQAEYPWGSPLPGARVRCLLGALQLPTTDANDTAVPLGTLSRAGYTGPDGRFDFALSTGEFGVSDAPVAIEIQTSLWSALHQTASSATPVLVAPRQPYTWLARTPATPRVGDEIRFHVGWCAPGGLGWSRLPEIEVHGPGGAAQSLAVRATSGGLESDPCRADRPGRYEAVIALPLGDDTRIPLAQTFDVSSDQGAAAASDTSPRLRAFMSREGEQAGVRVGLDGSWPGPLAVLIEEREPLAGRTAPALDGHAELFVPLPAAAPSGLAASLWGLVQGRPVRLADEPVGADPQHPPRLQLSAAPGPASPGSTLRVLVAGPLAGAVPERWAVLARLVPCTELATGARGPALTSRELGPLPSATIVASDGAPVERPLSRSAERRAPNSAAAELLTGESILWAWSGELASHPIELEVPIPKQAGLYRLLVTARDHYGLLATDYLLVDARCGIAVDVAAPPRWSLGDRSQVAIRLENGGPEPIEATLTLDVGSGLHVETVSRPAGGETSPATAAAPLTIALPSRTPVWLRIHAEAVRAGSGAIAVTVSSPGAEQAARRAYEVADEKPVSGPEAVRIQRTLVIRRAVRDASGDEESQERPTWTSEPWSPGRPVRIGELVRVREEVTLPDARADVEWIQRTTAVCHALPGGPEELHEIGQRTGDYRDELHYRVTRLEAGLHVHEYYLAAVRPGVCTLPPPTLRVGDAPLPVVVAPDEIRLSIVEGE